MPAKPRHAHPPAPRLPHWAAPVGVAAYVALVLAVDTLAVSRVRTPIDWSMFQWFYGDAVMALSRATGRDLDALKVVWLARFDFFKFFFWFLLPFLCCLPRMDWGWWSPRRWKRVDLNLFGVLALCGVAAVLIIPWIPALRATYASLAGIPFEQKWIAFRGQTVWVVSWLVGWEFLHRYVLLRAALRLHPRFGWVIVPLSETLYHLQKPVLEALGMAVFSTILTLWAMRRQNILLPLLAHLFIEIALILFLLLV